MAQALSSKLRWLTLGTQYDWPTRAYTPQNSHPFPPALKTYIRHLFPRLRPESGVVLLYSAKDYMPAHRDVSEHCAKPLASFSLGCDGIFILARGEEGGEEEARPRTAVVRVRSGDVVWLDGEARWAWHAMARTVKGTCPGFLAGWPGGGVGMDGEEGRRVGKWRGWMGGRRVNVSCRQVWD